MIRNLVIEPTRPGWAVHSKYSSVWHFSQTASIRPAEVQDLFIFLQSLQLIDYDLSTYCYWPMPFRCSAEERCRVVHWGSGLLSLNHCIFQRSPRSTAVRQCESVECVPPKWWFKFFLVFTHVILDESTTWYMWVVFMPREELQSLLDGFCCQYKCHPNRHFCHYVSVKVH